MRARVQRWGNSLAVRIPRSFAAEAGLTRDAPVELTVEQGRLIVVAAPTEAPSLAELLAGITDDNLHAEVDVGPPVGKEGW
jgi:antitoxin MazE